MSDPNNWDYGDCLPHTAILGPNDGVSVTAIDGKGNPEPDYDYWRSERGGVGISSAVAPAGVIVYSVK